MYKMLSRIGDVEEHTLRQVFIVIASSVLQKVGNDSFLAPYFPSSLVSPFPDHAYDKTPFEKKNTSAKESVCFGRLN